MRPSELSSRPNLRQTFLLPGDTPSEVDLPTLVGRSWYSIMIDLSLHTWTSAAESTSQQFCRGPSTARILGCQLLISGVVATF